MMDDEKFEEWLIDPAAHFQNPSQVVALEGITREQKIHLLQKWELNAKQLHLASEEGMGGGEQEGVLSEVSQALIALNADSEGDPSPTK